MIDVRVGRLGDLDDPGCREFATGDGPWPFRGFVVRSGDVVFAYENHCAHAGHPLNLMPDRFLTSDGRAIVCASHGARYEIGSGRCIGGPCRGQGLRALTCKVRDGEIWVTAPA